jgi:PST family polysaccharide transporter
MAWPIAYFYNDKTLVLPTIIISFNYILGAFKIVPMAILSKELKFNYVGKVRLISNLVSIFFMILFALLGFSYWSLIIPMLFVQLVQYIMFENRVKLGFKFYKFSYTVIAFRKTKSLLLSLSGANLINYWAANADNLIIGKYYSNYELGIYDKAYKMLQLSLSIITGLFNTVLYPSLKKYRDAGGKINPEYDSVLGIISLINFPVVAVLILFPTIIVKILWGENWLLVADYLPYFGLMIIYHTLLATTGQIFILLEKEKVMMKVAIFGDIVRIISMIIGSLYSVEGIIIGRLLSFFVLIIPLNLYVGFLKVFGYNWKYILFFWVPKIMIGIVILFALWFDYQSWLPYLLILYFIHIIYYQKTDILKFLGVISDKFLKK